MEEITSSLWSKKRSQPKVDCWTVHKDLLKDEEGITGFSQQLFHSHVCVCPGEPR